MLSAERNNLKLPEIGLEFEKMSRCPPVFYLAFLCVRARERESKSDNLFDPDLDLGGRVSDWTPSCCCHSSPGTRI
jgi:hypothetical protein